MNYDSAKPLNLTVMSGGSVAYQVQPDFDNDLTVSADGSVAGGGPLGFSQCIPLNLPDGAGSALVLTLTQVQVVQDASGGFTPTLQADVSVFLETYSTTSCPSSVFLGGSNQAFTTFPTVYLDPDATAKEPVQVQIVLPSSSITLNLEGTIDISNFDLCGSSAVDLERDPANCGTCGAKCSSGKTCQDGSCM